MTRSRDNATNVAGDISGVTAGTGLSGGGTDGAVTLNLSTPVAATNGGTGLSTFTTGDIPYASASNTLAKLAIGSTNQVLTVASGIPSWAAASSGALTYITSGSPNGTLTSHSFNNCFSSTYQNYLFICNLTTSLSEDQLNYRMRSSGSDATGGDYDYQSITARASTTLSGYGANNQSSGRLGNLGGSNTVQTQFIFYVNRPFDAAATTVVSQMSWYNNTDDIRWTAYGAVHTLTTSYDGFSLITSGGNMTGTIRIYGLANS